MTLLIDLVIHVDGDNSANYVNRYGFDPSICFQGYW